MARVLADPAATRTHMDVIAGGAADMVKALTADDSAERAPLVAQFDAALLRLQNDATLSRGDRVGVLIERVDLARLGQPKDSTTPKLPEALVKEVRELSSRMDREISDGYERQAVITAVAYLQGQAGLWADSDALLKANLAKSHSPYYLMSQLASNARKLGKKDEALSWYQQAYDKSVGPATRLQWGASYVSALIDLAPQDAPRIEKAAAQIFTEAGKDAGALHDRSGRSLQRIGKKLASWNADGKQAAAIKRLQPKVAALCAKAAAAEREMCQGLAGDQGLNAAGVSAARAGRAQQPARSRADRVARRAPAASRPGCRRGSGRPGERAAGARSRCAPPAVAEQDRLQQRGPAEAVDVVDVDAAWSAASAPSRHGRSGRPGSAPCRRSGSSA